MKRAILAVVLAGLAAAPAFAEPKFVPARKGAVKDQYIVVFDQRALDGGAGAVPFLADELAREHGGRVKKTWSDALPGFLIELPEPAARRLALDPRVELVDQDSVIELSAPDCSVGQITQNYSAPTSPQTITCSAPSYSTCVDSWGLDRIDQRALPRDSSYTFDRTGAGVHIYVLDTGIESHIEFNTPQNFGPQRIGNGRNFASNTHSSPYQGTIDPNDVYDCNGHGTHVSATAAGRRYGVAKEATIHPLRIGTCVGFSTESILIDAVNWVAASAVKPAVVNLSYNFDGMENGTNYNSAVGNAVRNLIQTRGIPFVNSAGNQNTEAANFIPTNVSEVIVVGGVTRTDQRWGQPTSPWFICESCGSNHGWSVDLFAPAEEILSANDGSATGACLRTGTSMAAPHVTGAIALYLQQYPNATVADVTNALLSQATLNALTGDLGSGSPNRLLYSRIP